MGTLILFSQKNLSLAALGPGWEVANNSQPYSVPLMKITLKDLSLFAIFKGFEDLVQIINLICKIFNSSTLGLASTWENHTCLA